MELRQAVHQAIERLLAGGRVKIKENGAWLASLENFQYEVREKAGAVLLHLWSPEGTLVRRVAGIAAQESGLLILHVNRFGRTKRDRLEFLSCERQPAQGQLRREQFRARLAEMLGREFPDDKILSLTSAPRSRAFPLGQLRSRNDSVR